MSFVSLPLAAFLALLVACNAADTTSGIPSKQQPPPRSAPVLTLPLPR